MTSVLSRARMKALLRDLNDELARLGVMGEISLVGGAVMCLVMEARMSTRDVYAFLHPAAIIRMLARRLVDRSDDGIPPDWLNDGVKGFLSPNRVFDGNYMREPLAQLLRFGRALQAFGFRQGRGTGSGGCPGRLHEPKYGGMPQMVALRAPSAHGWPRRPLRRLIPNQINNVPRTKTEHHAV